METRTRNRVIAFRVTPAERRKIEAKVRQSGLRQQEYLLHAALETPIHVVEDLKPLLGELRAWGRNREPADRPGPSGPHSDAPTCGRPRPRWAGSTRRSTGLLTEDGRVVTHGDVQSHP